MNPYIAARIFSCTFGSARQESRHRDFAERHVAVSGASIEETLQGAAIKADQNSWTLADL
jgi:hypothetical protein